MGKPNYQENSPKMGPLSVEADGPPAYCDLILGTWQNEIKEHG